MKKEHYDRIANSVIFVVIGVVLTADRFPDYKPYLLGLAAVAGAIAVWAYFKNSWASVDRTEEATPEVVGTLDKSEIVIHAADTFLDGGYSEAVEQYFAKHPEFERISITIRRSADVELSEYLHNYVMSEFAAKNLLVNSQFTIKAKKNPKLKHKRLPERRVENDYALAA